MISETNDSNVAPLVAAATAGAAVADIRLIIAAGFAVNGAEGRPSKAAVAAAKFGHTDVLNLLLEAKAAINTSTKVFCPLLSCASSVYCFRGSS